MSFRELLATEWQLEVGKFRGETARWTFGEAYRTVSRNRQPEGWRPFSFYESSAAAFNKRKSYG